jgi:hypothetical protein
MLPHGELPPLIDRSTLEQAHTDHRLWDSLELNDGAVVWPLTVGSSPAVLDPVEWIILQCLAIDDDIEGLVSDIAAVVGIDDRTAASRVNAAYARFGAAGLLEGHASDDFNDPLFALPLSH